MEQTLSLPSEWLPQDANIRAVKLSTPISPLFAGELIALVDTRYRDPDRLAGSIVMVESPRATEPMRLRRDGSVSFLIPLRDGAQEMHILRHDDGWQILGRVVKWIADAPAPARK